MMRIVITVLIVATLMACGRGNTSQALQGEQVVMRHAKRLTMSRDGDVTYVSIINPWDTTCTLHSYALVPHTVEVPSDMPDDVTLVRTPLQRAAVYTSVHAALLDELGCIDQIGGVCDAEYIENEGVHQRLASGQMLNYGSGLNPTIELIMDSRPDALMPSPFENAGYGRIEKLGIPIIECADYMETSPLARAEWMRFYGILFGCERRADSLFDAVEARYVGLRDSIAQRNNVAPRVMCDMLTVSTWYVPGARSTMGQLIADAGGNYVFAHLSDAGSVALSVESVMDMAHDADIWIIKYNASSGITYQSLAADNNAYTHFAPFVNRRIFGCNTAYIPYFEQASFHPDLVLSNLAKIFSQEVDTVDNGVMLYYTPIAE